jgi:hypothetical protein
LKLAKAGADVGIEASPAPPGHASGKIALGLYPGFIAVLENRRKSLTRLQ